MSVSIRKSFYCVILSSILSPFSVMAQEATPYKIDMERESPDDPIRKSTIMAKVKDVYPGKIYYIREDKTKGVDCHIVKSMGNDGEFRIIHVACD